MPFNKPGWNPMCFLTPQGFRYFMPGLIRIQLEALQVDAATANGWYDLDLLEFHLRDAESEQFSLFAPDEIKFMAELYQEILRCPGLEGFFIGASQLASAAQSWLTRAARICGSQT